MKKHKRKFTRTPCLQSIQTQFQLASRKQDLRHGGSLRKKRQGRGQRPLSCKESLHVVFKINRIVLKTQSFRTHQNFKLSHDIIQKYADRFKCVTDTQKSIQKRTLSKGINTVKRKLKLWMHRPFTRVVRGYTDYKNVRNYIQLNEKEALGEITYKKDRLRGLSMAEWEILWT